MKIFFSAGDPGIYGEYVAHQYSTTDDQFFISAHTPFVGLNTDGSPDHPRVNLHDNPTEARYKTSGIIDQGKAQGLTLFLAPCQEVLPPHELSSSHLQTYLKVKVNPLIDFMYNVLAFQMLDLYSSVTIVLPEQDNWIQSCGESILKEAVRGYNSSDYFRSLDVSFHRISKTNQQLGVPSNG